jgi:predicted nucleic acid-binding protein
VFVAADCRRSRRSNTFGKAAEIKATCRLSIADAWVAASAELSKATLVHKDPEFEPLPIPQRKLPYK